MHRERRSTGTARTHGTPVDGIVAVRCGIIPTSGVQIYQFVMSDQTKRIKNKMKPNRRKRGDETGDRKNGMRLK